MNKVDGGAGLMVHLPHYTDFVELINSNKKFNFTRLQHGEFDVISESYGENISQFYKDWDSFDYENITNQIVNHHVYKLWHGDGKDLFDATLLMLKVLREKNELIPSLMLGVSTGVGFGKFFGEGSDTTPWQIKRNKLLLKILEDYNQPIYHSGIPRHMGVMEETYDFFNKLNELNVDVVVFGADYLSLLKDEFKINSFTHITIPYKHAVESLNDTIKELIDKSTKLNNPIIFNSTGHLISANLAYYLNETNLSSFDFGRGFDWNLKKYRTQYPQIEGAWLTHTNEHLLKTYIKTIRNG